MNRSYAPKITQRQKKNPLSDSQTYAEKTLFSQKNRIFGSNHPIIKRERTDPRREERKGVDGLRRLTARRITEAAMGPRVRGETSRELERGLGFTRCLNSRYGLHSSRSAPKS